MPFNSRISIFYMMVSEPIDLPKDLVDKMKSYPNENWSKYLEVKIKERLDLIEHSKSISYDELVKIIDQYQLGNISFGKAVELSGLGIIGFQEELSKRHIKRDPGEIDIDKELSILKKYS